MSQHDVFAAPAEFKFAGDAEPGVFDGYGSVFTKQDWHRDSILPGAFSDTLAEHKAAGTLPAMFAEHSAFKGGDPLPIGVWTGLTQDDTGLHVKGKISALDTDHGRRVHALMKDGALRGLSIAFNVPPGGATFGKKDGEPKRTISKLHLHAIDIVRDPSHSEALIREVKSMLAVADHQAACDCIGKAMQLHRDTTAGGNSPTAEQRAQMMEHLQGAHKALTGEAMPAGMKAIPATIREFESWLREEFGISNSAARDIAERGFKSAPPRDEDGTVKEAMSDMTATLAAFSLTR